ncbi:MAG: hypothetical protein O8C67_00290 [Candidatus Methanoperedens sp.]|nr:hypothetical protein [Candidatus Methanoperedens sp.]
MSASVGEGEQKSSAELEAEYIASTFPVLNLRPINYANSDRQDWDIWAKKVRLHTPDKLTNWDPFDSSDWLKRFNYN